MQRIDTRRTDDPRTVRTRRTQGLWCSYCQREIQIELPCQTDSTQHKPTDNENQSSRRTSDELDGAVCSAGDPAQLILVERLTPRETQVLQLLAAEGMTNRQIAARLVISEKTVWKHLSNIYGKLGVSSRSEAIVWANRHPEIGWEDTRD